MAVLGVTSSMVNSTGVATAPGGTVRVSAPNVSASPAGPMETVFGRPLGVAAWGAAGPPGRPGPARGTTSHAIQANDAAHANEKRPEPRIGYSALIFASSTITS